MFFRLQKLLVANCIFFLHLLDLVIDVDGHNSEIVFYYAVYYNSSTRLGDIQQ